MGFSPMPLCIWYSSPMKRLLAIAVVLGWLVPGMPVAAVEYRLQVASLHERSFAHFLNGRIGRGEGELVLDRLERSLDEARVGWAALLSRPVRGASEETAAAFRAAKVRWEAKPGEGRRRWDEVVWEGKPGERSVWVIAQLDSTNQEVVHLGLKGKEALRYYIPYRGSGGSRPGVAVALPLPFLQFDREPAALWDRYLAKTVSLEQGIAAVVGVSENHTHPDWIYVIVEHPPTPQTFKVVVGWAPRPRHQDTSPSFRD